jgi:hypothetical protein
MRGFLVTVVTACVLGLPAAGLCGAAPDVFLLGAPFARSDVSPLGPGVTALRFEPGRGLVRREPVPAPAPPRADLRAASQASSDQVGVFIPLTLDRGRWKGARLRLRDGRTFGGQPRWFLFAASRGRGLGYSFLGDTSPDAGGWALERGGFYGEAQAGLAWRRAATQVSISYIQQEINVRLFGVEDVEERRGALTISRFLGDPKTPAGRLFPVKSALAPPRP